MNNTDLDLIDELVAQHQSENAEQVAEQVAESAEQVAEPTEEIEESGIPEEFLERMASSETEEEPVVQRSEEEELAAADDAPTEQDKANRTFKYLKETVREKEERIKALEDELKAQEALAEAIAQSEQKLKAKDDIIARIKLEESDQFQRDFRDPVTAQLSKAAKLVANSGELTVEGDVKKAASTLVKRAFSIKDPAQRRRFLLDEVPESHAIVAAVLFDADEKLQLHDEALQNARATKAALKETEERAQQVQTVKQLETDLEKVFDEMVAEGNFFYETRNGDSPDSRMWNQKLEERKLAVKQIRLKNRPEEINRLVAAGITAKDLQAELVRLHKVNKSLRSEISTMKKATPGVSQRIAPAATPAEQKVPMGTRDIIESLV